MKRGRPGNAMRRKRYLKTNSYTTVNTGSATPPRVEPVFGYRARARPIDDQIAKLFGLYDTIDNEPREQALRLMEEWQAGALATQNVYENITLVNGKLRKVFLFWNLDKTEFFFVELRYSPPQIRRSLGMHSREFAFTCYKNLSVAWYPFEPLSPEYVNRR